MSRFTKPFTVGDLREALKDVPDDLIVELSSDTGVDQSGDEVIVEGANRVKYANVDYFSIYVNAYSSEDEEEY